MNGPLLLAAVLTAGGCVFHASVTRRVIGPVAGTTLPRATRWLAELCWHFVSVIFAVMAAALLAGATGWLHGDAIRLVGVLAAAIAILCGISAMHAGHRPWHHPATYLLGAVAGLAFMGG